MKNKVKIILNILLVVLCFTSLGVSAATFINSKDVIYDNSVSGLKSTNVQSAVDELYSAATDYSSLDNRMLNFEKSLNPDKYIQPTPVDGVNLAFGGYIKIGKIVIVNMIIYIDKSKVTLGNSIGSRTKIMTNIPKGITNTEYLTAFYTDYDINGSSVTTTMAMIEDGNLTTYDLPSHPYTGEYGFMIKGTYLSSE